MSANAWRPCPRCTLHLAQRLDAEGKRVAALYGKVPVEEFDQARSAYQAARAEPHEETWREDYEFYGAASGVVHVRYEGGCSVCGLRKVIEIDDPIDMDQP